MLVLAGAGGVVSVGGVVGVVMVRRVVALVLVVGVVLVGVPGVSWADGVRDGQWYLADFDMAAVHELSQGAGVTIGVIDGGVDAEHPDLEGSVGAGTDFGDSTGDGLVDVDGHGTAVTSVLVGHGHGDDHGDGVLGIAPMAHVVSVGLDWSKSGYQGDELGKAITWLADQGVDIIVTSTGTQGDVTGDDSVKYATGLGIPVVGSAGNVESDVPFPDMRTRWPGRAVGAIPVTGTDRNGEFWERSIDLEDAAGAPRLGLSAPAVDVPVALPGGEYDVVNGTSFSAPIVAGTLALIRSAYPDLDYTTWLARMVETVDDRGPEGFDDEYGWGIVNPYRALTEDIKFDDGYDSIESKASDRLPLGEQGVVVPGDGDGGGVSPGDGGSGSAGVLVGSSGSGVAVWVWVVVGGVVLAGAVVIVVVVARARSKRRRMAGVVPPRFHPDPFNQAPTRYSDQPRRNESRM